MRILNNVYRDIPNGERVIAAVGWLLYAILVLGILYSAGILKGQE